eukprot:snap_masked-scaffold_1-processed-gene-2.33-mRNA-1 protein AED:1.00 eAED:1.00 QI:0/-1/0/0/-1/1/1/0/484
MKEKNILAQKIEQGVTVIGTAIAQLHLASPNPNALADDGNNILNILRQIPSNTWKFTNIEGGLLFIQDRHGNFFFQIYDLSQYQKRFEYELYENIDFKRLSDTFYSFEMEDCVCGFNFSSAERAERFYDKVSQFRPTGAYISDYEPSKPKPVKKRRSTKRRSTTSGSPGQIFTENGLIDASNIPREWKKILKAAGIRRKDLRNPKMIKIISSTLEKYDISIEPPPLDMDDEEIRQYYTPEQLQQYEKYKREMEAYEEDLERYEKEKAEYDRQQHTHNQLEEQIKKMDITAAVGNSGMDRLRQSVMQFQQKQIKEMLPQALEAYEEKEMPRMSVALPKVPALPKIPQKDKTRTLREQAMRNNVSRRQTKASKGLIGRMRRTKAKTRPIPQPAVEELGPPPIPPKVQKEPTVQKPKFLMDISSGAKKLKHVERPTSVLPDISNLGAGKAEGILDLLRRNLEQQRADLREDESDGDGSVFSDITDFD